MSWVKLHIGLRNNRDFRRLSDASQNLFFFMLMEAKDLDNGGALATRNGALSIADLADVSGKTTAWVESGLPDLIKYGFIVQRLDGAYMIDKWDEKAGALDPTGADRQRKYMAKKTNASVTFETPLPEEEEEVEKEVEKEKIAYAISAQAPAAVDSVKEPIHEPAQDAIALVQPHVQGNVKKPKHEPPPRDLAAYRILEAAWPVVHQHVQVPITATAWKQRNKAGALDFVDSGTSPQDVVHVLNLAYEHPEARRFYGQVSRLDKLAGYWSALLQCETGGSEANPRPDPFEHGGKSSDYWEFLERPVDLSAC